MRGTKRAKARELPARRKKAREFLMQMLFQMEIQGDFSEYSRDLFLERYLEDPSQLEYIKRAHQSVRDGLALIDEFIEESSDNWKASRMAKVDLTILRLAVAEIFLLEDIPDSVSANEAVEMARAFGGEDSPKFVNGVIGRLIRVKEAGARPGADG
jgi:N utilization substance protein B